MVKGIGVDMVTVSEMAEMRNSISEGSFSRIFSPAERKAAMEKSNPAEYLATRFAVKEAVFKAIAPLLKEYNFDFRIVETDNHEDGSPYIHITEDLRHILDLAGVSNLLVSITTENGYALAFVVAQ